MTKFALLWILLSSPAWAADCEVGCKYPQNATIQVVLYPPISGATSYRLLMDGAYLSDQYTASATDVRFPVFIGKTAPGVHVFRVEGRLASGVVRASLNNAITVLEPATPCTTTPLTFRVTRWPAGTTGSRRLEYTSNQPVEVTLEGRKPWTARAVDGRGCVVTVTK